MRARYIYEKFTQDSDPISDMNIGMRSISGHAAYKILRNELKEFGIVVKKSSISEYIGTNNAVEIQLYNIYGDQLLSDYVISFYNDKAAEMDGNPESGGWFIDEGELMDDPTYDTQEFIRIILEAIYGPINKIDERIEILNKIKKYFK